MIVSYVRIPGIGHPRQPHATQPSTSARAGPFDVMPGDDQRVLMTDRRVPVRMGVRFRPFPALMGVLVVLVMDVDVIVPEGHMDMLDLYRITRRP